jgi:hypothetical protein
MDTKPLARGDLERLIDELRRSADADTAAARPPRRNTERADGSPAGRIKRLLTVEAGLSQQQSIQELRAELATTVKVALPSAKGTSLDNWLAATISTIPAGEVLNAAMTVAGRHNC